MRIQAKFGIKPKAPKLDVRQRLLLFSLVAFIPLLSFAYISIQQNAANVRHQKLQSASATAKIVAVTVDQLIGGTQQFLASLGELPVVRNGEAEEINQLLARNLYYYPAYTGLFAADAHGLVYANAYRGIGEAGNISDRPYFTQLMDGCAPVVSNRVVGNINWEPSVVIATPLRNKDGKCSGLLGAVVSLAELQQQLASIGSEGDTTIIVVDRNGTALIHSNYDLMQDRKDFSFLDPVSLPLANKTGEMEFRNPVDGSNWLSVYTPVSRSSWMVLVGSPAAVVDASIQKVMLGGVLTLFVLLAAAIGIEVLLSERITGPLRHLSGQAMTLAKSFQGADINPEQDEVKQARLALDCLQSSLFKNSENLASMRKEIEDHRQRLQAALAETKEIQEHERKRIALDVHDGVVQFIIDALYKAKVSELQLGEDQQAALDDLRTVQELLRETMTEMRRVIFDLRPPDLESLGLTASIGSYLEGFRKISGLTCHLHVRGEPLRLSTDVELAIYRIVQEALQNTRKHASATSAKVELEFSADMLQLVVSDNGKGFDLARHNLQAEERQRTGLYSMKDRARWVGGNLQIESASGEGTRIVLRVPIAPEHDVRMGPTEVEMKMGIAGTHA